MKVADPDPKRDGSIMKEMDLKVDDFLIEVSVYNIALISNRRWL